MALLERIVVCIICFSLWYTCLWREWLLWESCLLFIEVVWLLGLCTWSLGLANWTRSVCINILLFRVAHQFTCWSLAISMWITCNWIVCKSTIALSFSHFYRSIQLVHLRYSLLWVSFNATGMWLFNDTGVLYTDVENGFLYLIIQCCWSHVVSCWASIFPSKGILEFNIQIVFVSRSWFKTVHLCRSCPHIWFKSSLSHLFLQLDFYFLFNFCLFVGQELLLSSIEIIACIFAIRF